MQSDSIRLVINETFSHELTDCHNANELLARLKSLLVMLLVIFFAYRIANRVGVLPFLEGVGCFFSIFTNS